MFSMRNAIRNKNLNSLVEEVCQFIQSNKIPIEFILIKSGQAYNIDGKLEIYSENGTKIDFVYSQHGFTPPSDAGAFARKLASQLNLFVKPFNSLELSRGYEPVLDYRLVKENSKIKEEEQKQKWKNLKRC